MTDTFNPRLGGTGQEECRAELLGREQVTSKS